VPFKPGGAAAFLGCIVALLRRGFRHHGDQPPLPAKRRKLSREFMRCDNRQWLAQHMSLWIFGANVHLSTISLPAVCTLCAKQSGEVNFGGETSDLSVGESRSSSSTPPGASALPQPQQLIGCRCPRTLPSLAAYAAPLQVLAPPRQSPLAAEGHRPFAAPVSASPHRHASAH